MTPPLQPCQFLLPKTSDDLYNYSLIHLISVNLCRATTVSLCDCDGSFLIVFLSALEGSVFEKHDGNCHKMSKLELLCS